MTLHLTITAKGQVTLRHAVLRHLNARPGQKIDVAFLPEGRVELRAIDDAPRIDRLRGALRRPGSPTISLADMQDAIERADPPSAQ
ncbi:AbrB/MazE/SpoVT family DNA-binding domain-containing protein [Acidiphilium sp.]|uniref:AbrB/MazE/SpoVT family DNA-binding domain-containing protein n=1 Tax=Acidiphilium sp. TaxID=527 RepID=UPI003D01BE9B